MGIEGNPGGSCLGHAESLPTALRDLHYSPTFLPPSEMPQAALLDKSQAKFLFPSILPYHALPAGRDPLRIFIV